ncbi:DNA recombination protein RmuC [Patescibacteria group bacterium]|nr:DNA recombination protein RmuC [Patescibacteria group bacterium]
MDALTFTLVIGIGLLLSAVGFLILQNKKKDVQPQSDGFSLLQEQLKEIRTTLDSKLGDSTKMFQEQYGQSVKLIENITEKLARLDETNKQVINFADQLQSLQDILQNPKRRGILGEYYLENILKNVLPPSAYEMQYRIGKTDDGEDLIVDAVIFVQDKTIPIDSKFSLENYNRIGETRDNTEREKLERLFKQDIKNRIDETAKYIDPKQGTMDFALMFIPSEAIFYDLLINKVGTVKVNTEDLVEYAARKHISIVSPNSFYALLQTVLQGLRQMKVEKETKEIIKRTYELGRHINTYEEYHKKLGNALGITVSHFNSSNRELRKIDKDVLRIAGSSSEVEVLELERPEQQD